MSDEDDPYGYLDEIKNYQNEEIRRSILENNREVSRDNEGQVTKVQRTSPDNSGDIGEESGERRRYLTFTMVVLLIGLIASFIVYYNDNDREVAFWVGAGLSALLFILLVYYFLM